jgi:Acetyltransferase (GNAT) domain
VPQPRQAPQARWQPLVESESVQRLSARSRPLTANIISSPAEVLDLTAFVASLVPEPGMLAPRFFLASLLPRFCKPCVVVVSQGQRVAGLLYGGERMVAGIPTGIVLGDDTLGTLIAAHPEERESVMLCAVEALLRHKAALRFRIASDRLAFLRNASAKANANIHFYREQYHAHLELPPTYDEFLTKVRGPTRHNLRRYRRRSELASNEFCPDQPFADFCVAAKRLFPKAAYAKSESNFQRYLAMIEAVPSRLLIGLRGRGGEWISLAGGWYASGRAVLCLQLNDPAWSRESVSLVLRSYLIEHLINRGIRELVFWAGTSPPLNSYAVDREEFMTYVDSQSHRWRLVRLACVTLAKFAPVTFGNWLKWEAPGANAELKA